jgi:hypothetical protein
MATAPKDSRAGSVVTQSCCPDCRLRFPSAVAAYLTACPVCGEPPQPLSTLAAAVGYRLFTQEDNPYALLDAVEASMHIPDPGTERS